jgi:predicted P-loop ATPase
VDALRRDRDQLWAEAKVRFEAGDPWWLEKHQLVELARYEQQARYQGDAWDELIANFVAVRESVSVCEVLQHGLGKETGQWSQSDQSRVARSLRSLGWEKFRDREGEERPWRYRPALVR